MKRQPGSQLGTYRLAAPTGAGGMGEVASDPDRLARFRRELRRLAAAGSEPR